VYGDRDALRSVSAAVLSVTGHLALHEVLQTVADAARHLLTAEYAALGVPDAAGGYAEFVTSGLDAERFRAIGTTPRQHGLLGMMLLEPAPVRLVDVHAHPRFEGCPDDHPELTNLIGAPIVDGGAVLGELFVANKHTTGGFTDSDEEMLHLLAAHAAIALVNARLRGCGVELALLHDRDRAVLAMHDAVVARLFDLQATLDSVAFAVTDSQPAAGVGLAIARRIASEIEGRLRSAAEAVRPADVGVDGLDAALHRQVELLNLVYEARIRFTCGPVRRLSGPREAMVFRIAQEALHNTLRYTESHPVLVELSTVGPMLVLEIGADGVDDRPAAGAAFRPGAGRPGAAALRELARSVGGRLSVTSRAGSGTTVRLEVPIAG
jgi:signal transduction histidine kinase